MKEFKEDKEDELENKLIFLAAKNLFLERPDSIKKETKITRKYMKEIDAFEAEIISIKELMIGTINYDCNRLLTDLNFKEKIKNKRSKINRNKIEKTKCIRKNY